MSRHAGGSSDFHDTSAWWNEFQKVLSGLTPTEKLRLIDEVARSLCDSGPPEETADRRANLDRLRRELAVLPVLNPIDGFSNRHHDDVLYGGPR